MPSKLSAGLGVVVVTILASAARGGAYNFTLVAQASSTSSDLRFLNPQASINNSGAIAYSGVTSSQANEIRVDGAIVASIGPELAGAEAFSGNISLNESGQVQSCSARLLLMAVSRAIGGLG